MNEIEVLMLPFDSEFCDEMYNGFVKANCKLLPNVVLTLVVDNYYSP